MILESISSRSRENFGEEDFLIDIAYKSNIIYINAEINFTIFRNRKYNSDISFSYSVKIK